jgi:hypothetical protein
VPVPAGVPPESGEDFAAEADSVAGAGAASGATVKDGGAIVSVRGRISRAKKGILTGATFFTCVSRISMVTISEGAGRSGAIQMVRCVARNTRSA